ncbi:protein mono-ADP-ribosyltransferase PARP10 [Aulostomus maculatus]
MPVESLDERSVEVLAVPEEVDEESLALYFENKQRSGGGPLLSLEKTGDRALLVFEEVEAAAQVLSKRNHVLFNVELSVRKPAAKDPCRLLLRGVKPNTCTEMIELYVETMIGVNLADYTLYPSPGRDLIVIEFSQPFSKDFQTLNAKISQRALDGAQVTLEQILQTDSVLLENLNPGTSPDLLSLYFDTRHDQKVKEVTMLSEGTAKVSFVSYQSVGLVLDRPHKLGGADLIVKPYFSFLQPTESTLQLSETESEDMTERNSEEPSNIQLQTSAQMALEDLPPLEMVDEVMDNQTKDTVSLSSHIAITDPVKLALFKSSTHLQDIEKAHPNVTVQINDDGVHVSGPERQSLEQTKHTILDIFANVAEARFTTEPEKAQFLSSKDVKDQLLGTMSISGSPCSYTVSDCSVVVTSLTQSLANEVCRFLKSQVLHISIPVPKEYECMLYCREWSEFCRALGCSSVTVSEQEGTIDVLTLKGMESEKQTAILEFLSTPMERETVISMEPGILKYIQIHCHQLLADMDQVSIFPLEAEDVCGLKIHGYAAACQMAAEVWQGVADSISSNTITVNVPGVARFLCEEECKSFLKLMETKFQVYISLKYAPWTPLAHQDIFEAAWLTMSQLNFNEVSLDGSVQDHESDAMFMDQNGAFLGGLLQEAKEIVSVIERRPENASSTDPLDDFDDVDLYTAETQIRLSDQETDGIVDDTQPLAVSGSPMLTEESLSSILDEEAQMSLAIQYSMESSHWSVQNEEEQLQKALELSKKMIQNEASFSGTDKDPQVKSLQDAIGAANTVQIVAFAGHSNDLSRVEIAFTKKVNQKQVEEKLEWRSKKNLTEYHKTCLEVIKRKHAVEIQIQGTLIAISGFKDYVAGAVHDVKLLLEKISNCVSDRDILKTIQWVHHDPASSDTVSYSPDATVFLENAWRMKLKKVDILLNSQPHIINFENMEEYSIISGKSVKISRKFLGLGDLAEDVPEEEYSLLSNLPEATKLIEESDEFQNVVKKFYETIQGYHSKIRIIQVEKLTNQLLHNQYKLKKASILQNSEYPEIERTLYHGTSETSVKEICIHGFNRSFCGKNATIYGQGVYFAVNSALSLSDQYSPPNGNGHKFVFVSKVLTGDFTKGCNAMKTAPLKNSSDLPLRYDSVTDNITKPSLFVIFNDTQAYPEYLITCQRIFR